MTLEDTIVCLCARQNFEPIRQQRLIAICQNRTIKWNAVYAAAEQHGVTPLVYVNLRKSQREGTDIPEAALNIFKRSCIHNVLVKQDTAAVLEKVLALFSQKGIDVMLVKGAALNLAVYEQPWYTKSADIDLVIKARKGEIPEADHREIVDVLEGFNYRYRRFKEHIEYDYYEHHDVTMNGILALNSERIWQESRRLRVNGQVVFVMAPEDMLIAAAVNSCRHRFSRLKFLCDVVAIIDKFPELNWDSLISKSREYKCNVIVYTALSVTQMTLGCPLPPGVLSDLKVNPVRATMIRCLANPLYRSMSLATWTWRSEGRLFGRGFSWPLVLVYATYRADQIGPKLRGICRAWQKSRGKN
jgi:hypothetical protein